MTCSTFQGKKSSIHSLNLKPAIRKSRHFYRHRRLTSDRAERAF